jgi:uncharacterized protein YbaP (TraB family)
MSAGKKSLLWEFSKAGHAAPCYLFGTMHVQDMRAFAFLEQAKAHMLLSGCLALELDLGQAQASLDPSLFRLPPGISLDRLLPPKKFEKLRRALYKTAQLDIAALRQFSPLLIVNLVNEHVLARDMPVPLDQHLWDFAQEQGLSVLGIETLEEQMQTLRHIPLELQLQSLLSLGRNFKRYRRQILRMAEVYASGDIYKLHRAAKRSASGLRGPLLYERNAIMAHRIAEWSQSRPLFCAVGAGHLAGGKGLIRLLKQQGFQVRAV